MNWFSIIYSAKDFFISYNREEARKEAWWKIPMLMDEEGKVNMAENAEFDIKVQTESQPQGK